MDVTSRGENKVRGKPRACPPGNLFLFRNFQYFHQVINVNAPLAELSGYSSTLRIITSGKSSMTMQPSGHMFMTPVDEQRAIRRTQGLE